MPPVRIAELSGDQNITAISRRLFTPAAGNKTLPLDAIRTALREANPTLDLDNPDRLPEGAVIAVPPVEGAEPVAELVRPVSRIDVAGLRDASAELANAGEGLDARIVAARTEAAEARELTRSEGRLRVAAEALEGDAVHVALDALRLRTESAEREADGAQDAQRLALEQIERDVEELAGLLERDGTAVVRP